MIETAALTLYLYGAISVAMIVGGIGWGWVRWNRRR